MATVKWAMSRRRKKQKELEAFEDEQRIMSSAGWYTLQTITLSLFSHPSELKSFVLLKVYSLSFFTA